MQQRDEAAFRRLVERHARLVLGVCRRILRSGPDVDDAFQATFLVLVRKAGSLRRRESLSAWLFKVAQRVALRAAEARRKQSEAACSEAVSGGTEVLEGIQERETFEILARELERLPEAYRTPLILFYLEGHSRADTAERLDCTEQAVKARLARGRRLLRQRLMRRGVALSVAMTALAASSATAAPPALLEATAAGSILLHTTGQAGAGSLTAYQLSQGVQTMAILPVTKSTLAAATTLAAGLLVTAGVALSQPPADGEPAVRAALDSTVEGPVPRRDASTGKAASVAADGGAAGEAGSAAAGDAEPAEGPGAFGRRRPVPVDFVRRRPNEEKIFEELGQPTDVEFIDIPLKDGLDYFSSLHEIPILVDERALREAGLSADEPVSIVLSQVSLRSALNLILGRLDLEYVVEDEVLQVTTRDAARARKETRVYPLADLVAAEFDPELLERILLKDDEGEIAVAGKMAVVTQSRPAHRKTVDLLEQLRRAEQVPVMFYQRSADAAAAVEGRVLRVFTAPGEEQCVEISLGIDDGLSKGERLKVLSNDRQPQLVGVVQVVHVGRDEAVARIVAQQAGVSVEEGHRVSRSGP